MKKMQKIISIMLIVAMVGCIYPSFVIASETVSLKPIADAKVQFPKENYGSDAVMNCYNHTSVSSYSDRAFIYMSFGVAGVSAGKTIDSAKLKIYVRNDSPSNNFRLDFWNVDTAWIESTINWVNQPIPYTADANFYPATPADLKAPIGNVTGNDFVLKEIDVTELVSKYTQSGNTNDFSMLIIPNGNYHYGTTYIPSKENADSSLHPVLELSFADEVIQEPDEPDVPDEPEDEPVKTYISQADSKVEVSSNNFGTDDVMSCYNHTTSSSYGDRGFIYMSFGKVSVGEGKTVESAKLKLYVKTNPTSANFTLGFWNVDSEWSESEIKWGNQPVEISGAGSSAETSYYPTTPADLSVRIGNVSASDFELKEIDITELVNKYVQSGNTNDFSVLIIPKGSYYYGFTYIPSREYAVESMRPTLTVTTADKPVSEVSPLKIVAQNYDAAYDDATSLAELDKTSFYKAVSKVYVKGNVTGTVMMAIASFNSDGEMLSVKVKNADFSDGSADIATESLSLGGNAGTIKAFLWEASTLKPVGEMITINVK